MTIDTQILRDLIRQACQLPWTLATSNSWRRIVDPYTVPVVSPCNQPDGHPDLAFPGGVEGPNARLLIEGINALPDLLDHIDAQASEVARLRADRDSWAEQASARVSDWDEMRADRDRLREALSSLVNDCETANRKWIDQVGIGAIDMNVISRGRAALQGEPKC